MLTNSLSATEAFKPNYPPTQSSDISDSSDTVDVSASSGISSAFQGTEPESAIAVSAGIADPSIERLGFLERAIDRLYRLSKHIRRPSVLHHNPKADNFPILDEADNNIDKEFTEFALKFITHRFPEISDALGQRLAFGIVIRRKRFLYRRNHQRKLSSATVTTIASTVEAPIAHDSGYETEETVKGYRVLVKSPIQERDGFAESLLPRPALSHTSASGEAQTSIPRERIDHDEESNQSTTFTNTLMTTVPIQVPSPPKPAPGGKEFECPFCCTILPISHARAAKWRSVILLISSAIY